MLLGQGRKLNYYLIIIFFLQSNLGGGNLIVFPHLILQRFTITRIAFCILHRLETLRLSLCFAQKQMMFHCVKSIPWYFNLYSPEKMCFEKCNVCSKLKLLSLLFLNHFFFFLSIYPAYLLSFGICLSIDLSID